MKLNLSSVKLQIPCPGCGQKIPETIGRLQDDPKITCPACGKLILVSTTELDKGIKAVEKSLGDFGKSLQSKFK